MLDKKNGEDNAEDAMQDMIGQQLRNLYDSVLAEPIPDRLVELLLRLDEVTEERSGALPNSADMPDNDNQTERK